MKVSEAGIRYFQYDSNKSRTFTVTVLCLAIASVMGFLISLSLPVYIYGAVFLLLAVLLIFFAHPFTAFLVLLFLRPLLDPLSQYGVAKGINILALFSLIFIGFLIIVMFTNRKNSWRPGVAIYFHSYLLATTFSFVNLDDFYSGLTFFLKLSSLLAIYLLAYHLVNSKRDGHMVFLAVVLSSIIPISYGLLQVVTGSGVQQGIIKTLRINSTFVLSNPYAFYLCIITLVLIYLLFFQKSLVKQFNLFIHTLLLLAFISLMLTYTRAAWLAVTVGLIIFALKDKRLRIYLLLLGVVSFMLTYQQIFERISDLIQPRRYGINSLQFRLDIAKQLLENAFPEHFLVGFGLGSSEHVAARYTKYMLLPHNDFLRSLIETGLIGLIGFIGFLIMNFKYYIQRVRQFPSRPYNLFMFALLSTYVVVAFAQNISVFISTAGYVFCFLGVTQKLNDLEEINNK